MFDSLGTAKTDVTLPALDPAAWVERLAQVDRHLDDTTRIDLLRGLEELKGAAAAAQAVLSVDLNASPPAAQAAAGVPAAQQGRGVAAQVALARRDSPHRGGRHLGLATALVGEMPFTLAALRYGRISEWRATLLGRETACLSREDRSKVDAELCADLDRLESYGDRQLVAEAKKIAYRLDSEAVVARARKAHSERCVTIRPAPDTMSYLTGLLPVAHGVAVYAALKRAADTLVGTGDGRTRGQIMADTLVQRVTGTVTTDGATADPAPVTVNLTRPTRPCSARTTNLPTCTATARSRRASPATWSAQPSTSGSAASTPHLPPVSWSRWTPGPGYCPRVWPRSSRSVTRSAAPHGATPRSATTTTPSSTSPADHLKCQRPRPVPGLQPHQAGQQDHGPDPCTPSRRSPRPDTPTPRPPPEQPGRTRHWIPTYPGVWTAA